MHHQSSLQPDFGHQLYQEWNHSILPQDAVPGYADSHLPTNERNQTAMEHPPVGGNWMAQLGTHADPIDLTVDPSLLR